MQATIIRSNPAAVSEMRPEKHQQSLTKNVERGVVLLDDLGTIVFDGADVAGFLQGYLTTDTTELGGNPQFTALCNIKGRVVCTGYVWLENQAASLILHRSLCPVVMNFLRPYLAFSKTSAAEASLRVFGTLHRDASAAERGNLPGNLPGKLPGRLPAAPAGTLSGGGPIDGTRHLYALDEAALGELLGRTRILDHGLWDRALVERREVWLQAQTSGKFLPQMLGLDELGAVSFAKGCYLGQEVVARAQHRGKVKRRLTALDWSGAPPSTGASVEAGGREVGTVVSSAGADAQGLALAVLVRSHSGPFHSPATGTHFHLQVSTPGAGIR